jgi:lysophospholipase L1-like esterase
VATRPDEVIVLVGGDDVLARTFRKMGRWLAVTKRLPREPSAAWYASCLREIVRELKSKTTARVALCSLCPIGEDPTSTEPHQRMLDELLAEYSGIVERIARDESVSYVPVYECLRERIAASPGRAFTDLRFWRMYRDAFRTLVLRRDLDALGAANGWRFHTDGIHLNARAGKVVADLLQTFVASP